jgi:hypothetical protein
MLFNVQADAGFLIKGYAVSDHYDKYCNLVLKNDGRVLTTVVANLVTGGQLAGGRHIDSNCGFCIDEGHLPDLPKFADLEIRDEETNVLIYRRFKPGQISKKIFRPESHFFPLWRLDKPMSRRFQYWTTQIERFGWETMSQIVHLAADSVYASGRIMYSMFRPRLEEAFKVVFMMHHPYEELAERLIVLSQIPENGGGVLAPRDASYLAPLLGFAKSLPLDDENALIAVLRDMPNDVARFVANPVTRQLTCERMEDAAGMRALGAALDVLSSFEIVGLRRASTSVLRALGDLSQLSSNMLPPLSTLPGVTPLAKALRRSREFEYLLEQDLQLYAHVVEAYRKAKPPDPTNVPFVENHHDENDAIVAEQAAYG